MQNKKILIIVCALLVLILLLIAIPTLVKKPESAKTESKVTTTTTNKPVTKQKEETTVTGSILDLLKMNKSLKCTYTLSDVSGTTYISGSNVRGDFEMTNADNQKINTHMISDGVYAYTWSSMSDKGIKIKVTTEELKAATDSNKPDTGQNFDTLQKNYDYKCTTWSVDNKLFEIPSNVTFSDMSSLINTKGTDNKQSLCAACDYAQSDADKTACKQRLGCN